MQFLSIKNRSTFDLVISFCSISIIQVNIYRQAPDIVKREQNDDRVQGKTKQQYLTPKLCGQSWFFLFKVVLLMASRA